MLFCSRDGLCNVARRDIKIPRVPVFFTFRNFTSFGATENAAELPLLDLVFKVAETLSMFFIN